MTIVAADRAFLTAMRGYARSSAITSAERVADAVRTSIDEGHLKPGEQVPEKELGIALEYSRNTVREGLSQLVNERLLTRRANRGVFVSQPNLRTVQDVYRARRMIEPSAIKYAVIDSGNVIADIRAAVDEAKKHAHEEDWLKVASANQYFHRSIVRLSGSTRIIAQMDLLLAEMRLIFHRMASVSETAIAEFHEPYIRSNTEILESIEQGLMKQAARQMVVYLEHAETEVSVTYASNGFS